MLEIWQPVMRHWEHRSGITLVMNCVEHLLQNTIRTSGAGVPFEMLHNTASLAYSLKTRAYMHNEITQNLVVVREQMSQTNPDNERGHRTVNKFTHLMAP